MGNSKVTNIGEVHTDHDKIVFSSPHVVIVGAPFEAQTIVGPFDSFEDAADWADTECDEFTWVASLVTPESTDAA